MELLRPAQVEMKIFDAVGQLIMQQPTEHVVALYTTQINLDKVASGIYFLQLMVGETILNKKIEIQ
jgi:hypothetical protein